MDDGNPIAYEDCLRWVDITLGNYQKRGYGMFKIYQRDTDQLVGCAGIVHPNNQVEPEIKYCLLRQHWGQGIATEIVKGLLEYGHSKHGLRRFIATVAPENLPSQNVLEKSGFKQTKTDAPDTLLYSTSFDDDPSDTL